MGEIRIVCPLYEYICEVCKREFEELKSIKERHDVVCCGVTAIKLISTGVYTDKDQKFNVTRNWLGKPVEIRSHGQYESFLKKQGRVDCSPQEMVQHCASVNRGKGRERKLNIRRRADKLASRLHKEGVVKGVPSFIKKFATKKLNKGM